jgi:hypothetical protein
MPTELDLRAADVRLTRSVCDRCPRCSAPCGAPNLLTSMMRYYACARCACRWQVPRLEENDLTPTAR